MKHYVWIACVMLGLSGSVLAQGGGASQANDGGTPLFDLIEAVAKNSDKTFILDPRVSGNARLIGIDPTKVTYAQLLPILQVHGLVAVESGRIVRIVPDEQARVMPGPVVDGNEKRSDAEFVTKVIPVRSIPAAQLVPVLRPLIQRNGHMAAFACTNELVVSDTFANIRRVEEVIARMDKGDPLQLPKCDARPPGSSPSDAPARPAPPPAEPER